MQMNDHQAANPCKLTQTANRRKLLETYAIQAGGQKRFYNSQKGLEVCYCLWGRHPDPRLGPILGPFRSHPGSEGVPSRFAMCFVLQCFEPIQVPRWGPSRPVLVLSCSRAFLPGSGLDGPKQTSWPLPKFCIQA